MEQRTLLALTLSLLVLVVYNFALPKSKIQPAFNYSQNFVNKELNEYSYLNHQNEPEKNTDLSEKVDLIRSAKVELEISNKGAYLKTIKIRDYNLLFPLTNSFSLIKFKDAIFNVLEQSESFIKYGYEDEDIVIIKTFKFLDSNLLEVNIDFQHKQALTSNLDINIFSIHSSKLDNKYSQNEKSLLEYSLSTESGIYRKGSAFSFTQKEKKQDIINLIKWIGFRDRYFCAIFKPEFEVQKFSINPASEKILDIALLNVPIKYNQNGHYSFSTNVFIGPQDVAFLKKYNQEFENIVSFSSIGLFNAIALFIYNMIGFLHKVIPSWGLCIIIISMIIYLSLYPLTFRAMSSMKKMQSLQPKISKLREQYSNNPQKLNMEMMELYKQHQINPLGGCLPFLIQMPIFISFYQVLWRSIYFKGAHFLWIKDLSEPDRLLVFPFTLPIIGNELNILPIIVAIVMFFQQKITAKSAVITDPSQASQQKIMTTILPFMFGFIFYKFSSGLSIYMITFYLLSTLTQIRMSKINYNVQ